jgi:guanosine-3',5'-bis(diphosphate) 3'-pyrophosphohydrolase
VRRLAALLGNDKHVEKQPGASVAASTVAHHRKASDPGVTVKGTTNVQISLARCCTPVPGDDVLGFIRRRDVSVHRTNCTNAGELRQHAERLVDVEWTQSESDKFLVEIQIEARDRPRLLSDLTKVVLEQKANVLSASVITSRDKVAVSRFSLEMGDAQLLRDVLNAISQVQGVYDTYRLNTAK